jgi:non-ribosomal peptide synthetase component F
LLAMLARRFLAAAATRTATAHATAQPLTLRLASHRPLALAFSTVTERAAIVHKSPHGEIEIPETTIWEVLQERAEKTPDKPAFIDGLTHEEVSFRELYEQAKRVAVSLAKDGVKKGDVSAALGVMRTAGRASLTQALLLTRS